MFQSLAERCDTKCNVKLAGFDSSFKCPTCLTTLKSCDTTKTVFLWMTIYIYIYIYIYLYMCVCVCVCVHIYSCVCLHMSVHIPFNEIFFSLPRLIFSVRICISASSALFHFYSYPDVCCLVIVKHLKFSCY